MNKGIGPPISERAIPRQSYSYTSHTLTGFLGFSFLFLYPTRGNDTSHSYLKRDILFSHLRNALTGCLLAFLGCARTPCGFARGSRRRLFLVLEFFYHLINRRLIFKFC